jgi:hypothetical protein
MSFLRRKPVRVRLSKDYVEHVRKTHFALTILAVTGIIVGLLPDFTDLQNAERESRRFAAFMSNKVPEFKKPAGPQAGYEDFVIFRLKDRQYAAFVPTGFGLFKPNNCGRPVLPPRGRLSGQTLQFLFTDVSTVAQLKQYWDFFACTKIDLLGANALGDALIVGDRKLAYHLVTSSGAKLATSGVTMIDLDPDDMLSEKEWQEHIDKAHIKFVNLPSAGHEPVPLTDLGGYSAIVEGDAVLLAAKVTPIRTDMPAKRINFLQHGWDCSELFAQCFPFLSKTVDEHPDYDWNDLSEFLKGELDENEGKVEIFGLKPPPAEESYWGILAILCVLFYFWILLRQVSPRLSREYSWLDVPWVGFYSTIPAVALIWCSVLLVPLFATVALGIRAMHSDFHHWWSNRAVFSIVFPTAILCSLLSILSCLKVRRLAGLATEATLKQALDTGEGSVSGAGV